MPRCLLTLLTLMLTVAMTGCTTPSGQAFSMWLSRPLEQLSKRTNPQRYWDQEIRHVDHMVTRGTQLAQDELAKPKPLVRNTGRQARDTYARSQRLPQQVTAAARYNTDAAKRGIRNLTHGDGLLAHTLDAERHATAVRRIFRRLPSVLRLDRPILPARDDTGKQTGPFPGPPTETWVERILRRVRL